MKASKVHAVVAAGLDSPALIALWQQDPERLRHCGVDPDTFDFDALQKFAGLTAKVRHNGLRIDLPLTFRLLNVAGLEIELFSAYARFRAGTGYAATTAGRAQDLLSFMSEWLDFDRLEHVLLWDLMRFELALTNLGNLSSTSRSLKVSSTLGIPRASDVPRVLGNIVLLEMRSDPRAVGAMLQEKAPRLNEVELGSFNFCYWRKNADPEIQILELDELGYCLLTLIDGARSIAALSRMITGTNRTSRGIARALAELGKLGIISFVTQTVSLQSHSKPTSKAQTNSLRYKGKAARGRAG